jgi:4-hydroxy-tetrahydrodipicolinate synthase
MIDGRPCRGPHRRPRRRRRLLPLTLALFAEPSPAVIKAVLQAQGKIPTAHVRMPLSDASPAARDQALAALDAAVGLRRRVTATATTLG